MKMSKTKWEFERAQLLATGATTKGLSERHSWLRLDPAAVQKVPVSLWAWLGACVHSLMAWMVLLQRGCPLLPGEVLWASSHVFTILCSNGPFPCEDQSLLKISRSMEQVGSCSEGSEPGSTSIAQRGGNDTLQFPTASFYHLCQLVHW